MDFFPCSAPYYTSNLTLIRMYLTLALIGACTALQTIPKDIDRRDYFSDRAPGQCPASPCTAADLLGEWANNQSHAGVNLGGWLVLEDWFFSSAAPGDTTQRVGGYAYMGEGRSFPSPCDTSSSSVAIPNAPWKSEGLLTTWLRDEHTAGRGPDPTKAFKRHRETFITQSDFEQIAALGLEKVRVPIPWQMFADALCKEDDTFFRQYCFADLDADAKIVPDPYYSANISLVTVPRKLVRRSLVWAKQHKLHVVFDIHTMPGGSSNGTYSSVWPLPPAFWQRSVRNITLRSMGLSIVDGLLDWVADLGPLKDVVAGFTFMNEPAMTAKGGKAAGGEEWLDRQEDVLDWLADAGSRFENARPRLASSAKVYLNFHMSAFQTPLLTDPSPHPAYVWFRQQYENKPWTVLDIHWYGAWEDKPPSCGEHAIDNLLLKFQEFINHTWLQQHAFANMSLEGRMSISELSASTFHVVALACRDAPVLRSFAHKQVVGALDQGIEPFFWTWRMPEGGIFQDGWSLKKITGYEKEPHGRFCSDDSTASS